MMRFRTYEKTNKQVIPYKQSLPPNFLFWPSYWFLMQWNVANIINYIMFACIVYQMIG